MKNLLLFGLLLVWSIGIFAQEAARENETTEKTEKSMVVPTTIDFQGRLHDSGDNPVNASLSMTFSLYTVASGGTAQWTEVRTVQVVDGLFQVKLGEVTPFNESHFNDPGRWLGIKVGSEAEMSPRTKFSSVGYAMQSLEWDPTWWEGGNPDGDIGRAGRVGIGTGDPAQTLDVAGTMRLRGHLFDYSNTSGTAGQVLSRGASGVLWANPAAGPWVENETAIYSSSDKNFGLGINTPSRKLTLAQSGTICGMNLLNSSTGFSSGDGLHLAMDGLTGWLVNVENGPLNLGTSNMARLTILPAGNVGIQTTSPRQQLSVGAYLDLYSGYVNSPTRPSIRSSPNNNLIINAYDTGILYFNLDGGTGETRFYAGPAGAEILRITSDGNLGIGTTSPTAQLHTTGSVRFQNLSGSVTRNLVVSSNGTLSIDMPITYSVGLNNDLGGYVFYVTPDGRHGLVVATQNQATSCTWYDAQNMISNPSNHNTAGKKFTDWRLPTKYELNLMYTLRATIGNLGNNYYWSSTESSSTNAWYQIFMVGDIWEGLKTTQISVRAIRSF